MGSWSLTGGKVFDWRQGFVKGNSGLRESVCALRWCTLQEQVQEKAVFLQAAGGCQDPVQQLLHGLPPSLRPDCRVAHGDGRP